MQATCGAEIPSPYAHHETLDPGLHSSWRRMVQERSLFEQSPDDELNSIEAELYGHIVSRQRWPEESPDPRRQGAVWREVAWQPIDRTAGAPLMATRAVPGRGDGNSSPIDVHERTVHAGDHTLEAHRLVELGTLPALWRPTLATAELGAAGSFGRGTTWPVTSSYGRHGLEDTVAHPEKQEKWLEATEYELAVDRAHLDGLRTLARLEPRVDEDEAARELTALETELRADLAASGRLHLRATGMCRAWTLRERKPNKTTRVLPRGTKAETYKFLSCGTAFYTTHERWEELGRTKERRASGWGGWSLVGDCLRVKCDVHQVETDGDEGQASSHSWIGQQLLETSLNDFGELFESGDQLDDDEEKRLRRAGELQKSSLLDPKGAAKAPNKSEKPEPSLAALYLDHR